MPLELKTRNSRPPDYHLPCPRCGPQCKTASGKNKKTVGVWEDGKGGRRTWCIRCHAKDRDYSGTIGPLPQRNEPRKRDTSGTARWLWSQSQPLKGSLGEVYLRQHRGIDLDTFPKTMRFLPASGDYPAAIITAFGNADGTEPGDLSLQTDVSAVHRTILDEAGNKIDKRMLGPVSGKPLCLAPVNDAGGLAITEGIEDALSIHVATGLGAWAAGSAIHMGKLADAVHPSVEVVTVAVDADLAGRKGAKALMDGLQRRRIEVRSLVIDGS